MNSDLDRTVAVPGPVRWLRSWLLFLNLMSVVIGLALVFAFYTPPFEPYRAALSETFFLSSQVPAGVSAYFGWSMALIGAATVGWAVTNLFIIFSPLNRGEGWSFAAIVASTLLWAVLELVVSIPVGAVAEVAFVVPVALSVVIPTSWVWLINRKHLESSK